MKLFKKEISKHKLLYGGLITTFAILYGATAFVSWYHAITFFNIANAVWLSVILSFVAEIGQASALFSLLLTENKNKYLTWFVMVILTSLQVVGNVVSSYDWIIKHNSAGVDSFQQSILFWMTTADPQIFKVVIAWISGALLPIIALSMTALVAQNMDLRAHDAKTKLDAESKPEDVVDNSPPKAQEPEVKPEPIDANILMSEVSKVRLTDEELERLSNFLNDRKPIEKPPVEEVPFRETEQAVRMRELMNKKDIQTTIIPEALKGVLAPGVEDYEKEIKADDTLKSNINQTIKEYTHSHAPQSIIPDDKIFVAPPVIPHYSDEEVFEMNQDEYERKWDQLDEEAAELTPEIVPEPIIEPEPLVIEVEPIIEEVPEFIPEPVVKHQNGLVEGLGEITPKVDEDEKKRLEEQRLEKIRRRAKEQQDELKKK